MIPGPKRGGIVMQTAVGNPGRYGASTRLRQYRYGSYGGGPIGKPSMGDREAESEPKAQTQIQAPQEA